MTRPSFDIECRRCERLARFLDQVRTEYPSYHARPVAPFGDPSAHVLIVGLAPGMHGANATGRPFTGDYAGLLLYQTLFKYSFANQPTAQHVADGLRLLDCRITNAVKCLPPQNKPVGAEINACNGFLAAEIEALPPEALIVALGSIAHNSVLKACGLRPSALKFAHGAEHRLSDGRRLLDSYHCSRYNTQTRRLTEPMFRSVFRRARELLDER